MHVCKQLYVWVQYEEKRTRKAGCNWMKKNWRQVTDKVQKRIESQLFSAFSAVVDFLFYFIFYFIFIFIFLVWVEDKGIKCIQC